MDLALGRSSLNCGLLQVRSDFSGPDRKLRHALFWTLLYNSSCSLLVLLPDYFCMTRRSNTEARELVQVPAQTERSFPDSPLTLTVLCHLSHKVLPKSTCLRRNKFQAVYSLYGSYGGSMKINPLPCRSCPAQGAMSYSASFLALGMFQKHPAQEHVHHMYDFMRTKL